MYVKFMCQKDYLGTAASNSIFMRISNTEFTGNIATID